MSRPDSFRVVKNGRLFAACRPTAIRRPGDNVHKANSHVPRRLVKRRFRWAYREFYRWSSITRASFSHGTLKHQAKHFFYAAGWKKFEPLWDLVIRAKQLPQMTPLLESVLARVTERRDPDAVPDPLTTSPPADARVFHP